MYEITTYYVATVQSGSVGERLPEHYISGPYSDPEQAVLARDRIGSDLMVVGVVDFDEGPTEQVA